MTAGRYFTQETIEMLSSLRKNNNREWYHQNKSKLDDYLIAPAKRLVVEVGEILGHQAEGLVADPRVDRSIYRLYRDTRFGKDKKPYKEHLGLIWWQDLPEGKLSSPCFYFQVSPEGWLWSAGCYRFTPAMLLAFRRAIIDPDFGPPFKHIAKGLRGRGLDFNPPDLKRLPRGFQGPEWASEFLRRKGLYTWSEFYPSADFNILGPKAAQHLAKQFMIALPIHLWLKNLFEKARTEGGEPSGLPPSQPTAVIGQSGRVKLPGDDF